MIRTGELYRRTTYLASRTSGWQLRLRSEKRLAVRAANTPHQGDTTSEGLLEVSICQGEVIFAIAVDTPEDARAAAIRLSASSRGLPLACTPRAAAGGT